VMNGIDKFADTMAAAPPGARAALLDGFAARVHAPYMLIAVLMAVLALGIALSPLPEIGDEANPGGEGATRSLWQQPQLWTGVLCMFCYVGVEVMAGDAIGTYGNGFGLPLDQTKFFTAFTLGGMLVGYVAGLVTVPKFLSQERYLAASAVLGIVLSLLAFATKGYTSVACVAGLGFANAMMFCAIFPLGIRGLGRHTEVGSAIMVMGIAGGAVLPQLFAHMKGPLGFQLSFVCLMVPAYLYILGFGLFASRQTARAAILVPAEI
jgi:FHS family L-fucose permease-like MFS transporter